MGLLKTYCNRESTTCQLDVLVAAARRQRSESSLPLSVRTPRAPRKPKKLPADTERAIIDAYRAGQTMKQIAAEHHIHRTTVSEVLERTDTARRPKGMNSTQRTRAIHLYKSGESLATIGTKLGFHATTIRTMLLQRGVTTRDSHGRPRSQSDSPPIS